MSHPLLSSESVTLFIAACKAGNRQEVSTLLEAEPLLAHASAEEGVTALMEAAASGKTEICQVLLQNGAIINAHDEAGKSAVIYATYFSRHDTIRFLVEKSADIHQADKKGRNALYWAEENGDNRSLAILLDSHERQLQIRHAQQKLDDISKIYTGITEPLAVACQPLALRKPPFLR